MVDRPVERPGGGRRDVPRALLLLGPTGSGKTPLGELLERRGFRGRPCAHFDFGARLRAAAAEGASSRGRGSLGAGEVACVRRVLETGALLEDHEFPIAEKVLRGFLDLRCAGADVLVVLNGLPRHAGQADALGGIVDVRCVASLSAAPEVAFERIRSDTGGDRTGRTDDHGELVRRKLGVFESRTAALRDLYRNRGVPVVTLVVSPTTSAEELRRRLEAAPETAGLAYPPR